MKAEQVSRLRELRRMSEVRPPGTSRLRFFGFDIDAAVGGGYEDVNGLLSPHREDSRLHGLARALERVAGESVGEELARVEPVLQHLREHRPALEEALGAGTYEAVLSSVLTLHDSLRFVEVAHPATDWRTVSEAMAEREEAMFQRVRRMLSRLGPGEKVILQGHAGHLSKDWPSVRQFSVWAGPPKHNLGTRLLAEYPGQVFSIWMVHGRGRSAQPFTSLPSKLQLVPGTLNALLARIGACFLLPPPAQARNGSPKSGISPGCTTACSAPRFQTGRRTLLRPGCGAPEASTRVGTWRTGHLPAAFPANWSDHRTSCSRVRPEPPPARLYFGWLRLPPCPPSCPGSPPC